MICYHITNDTTTKELYALAETERVADEIASVAFYRRNLCIKQCYNQMIFKYFQNHHVHGYLDSSDCEFGTILMTVEEMCQTYPFKHYSTEQDGINWFLAKYQTREHKLKGFL